MPVWTPFSPAPWLRLPIASTDAGVCSLALNLSDEAFVEHLTAKTGIRDWTRDPSSSLLAEPIFQLEAYLRGELRTFDVPLDLRGTAFQRRVWSALMRIPYGRTTSYGALARELGSPGAMRAVGAANGKNPVGIIVPCHRVVASDGSLGGYGGGLDLKRWLLELEATGTPPAEPPRQLDLSLWTSAGSPRQSP